MQTTKSIFPFVALFCFALFAGMGVWYFFLPLPERHESVTVVVPAGGTARQVADSLRVRDVITSRTAFLLWMKATGRERSIQAGKYSFARGGGVIAAVTALSRPIPIELMVTIPEGLTVEQTAACLLDVLPIDTLEFVALCSDTAYMATLEGIEADSLEGYLFPDSYRFLKSAGEAEIIRRMVTRFFSAYGKIDTASMAHSPTGSRLTRHQIVTLASIVEKEAVLAEERPRIAGVFHNRLRKGYPLGADPTVRYIFRKFSGPLRMSELNADSPYNTRRFKGLPPGPICSPGLASLQAAACPDKTDDLFFVARWDGSGAHDFSVTNEEHARKKFRIRKQNMRRLLAKEE